MKWAGKGRKEWLNGALMGEQRIKLDHDGADMLFKALF